MECNIIALDNKKSIVYAEYFLGKSVKRIEKDLQQQGYRTHVEKFKHKTSKAKKIIVDNPSKTKNISVVQVKERTKPRIPIPNKHHNVAR